MDAIRLRDALVFLACLAGGIYYMSVDKEMRGAVVVLLGILYYLAAPRVLRE
jgi:hypothetical protein